MNDMDLDKLVAKIIAAVNPSRVILFGSTARNDADSNSDLDLMVIKPQVNCQYEEIQKLYRSIGQIGVGVDLLLYSEEEFARRSKIPGTVLYWAQKEGRSLYET